MPCFCCGKRVSLVRQMADADFCSDEHRRRYHSLMALAFDRLLEHNGQAAPLVERPQAESIRESAVFESAVFEPVTVSTSVAETGWEGVPEEPPEPEFMTPSETEGPLSASFIEPAALAPEAGESRMLDARGGRNGFRPWVPNTADLDDTEFVAAEVSPQLPPAGMRDVQPPAQPAPEALKIVARRAGRSSPRPSLQPSPASQAREPGLEPAGMIPVVRGPANRRFDRHFRSEFLVFRDAVEVGVRPELLRGARMPVGERIGSARPDPTALPVQLFVHSSPPFAVALELPRDRLVPLMDEPGAGISSDGLSEPFFSIPLPLARVASAAGTLAPAISSCFVKLPDLAAVATAFGIAANAGLKPMARPLGRRPREAATIAATLASLCEPRLPRLDPGKMGLAIAAQAAAIPYALDVRTVPAFRQRASVPIAKVAVSISGMDLARPQHAFPEANPRTVAYRNFPVRAKSGAPVEAGPQFGISGKIFELPAAWATPHVPEVAKLRPAIPLEKPRLRSAKSVCREPEPPLFASRSIVPANGFLEVATVASMPAAEARVPELRPVPRGAAVVSAELPASRAAGIGFLATSAVTPLMGASGLPTRPHRELALPASTARAAVARIEDAPEIWVDMLAPRPTAPVLGALEPLPAELMNLAPNTAAGSRPSWQMAFVSTRRADRLLAGETPFPALAAGIAPASAMPPSTPAVRGAFETCACGWQMPSALVVEMRAASAPVRFGLLAHSAPDTDPTPPPHPGRTTSRPLETTFGSRAALVPPGRAFAPRGGLRSAERIARQPQALAASFPVALPLEAGFAAPAAHWPALPESGQLLGHAAAATLPAPAACDDARTANRKARLAAAFRLSSRPSRLPVLHANTEKAHMPYGVFSYLEHEDCEDRSTVALAPVCEANLPQPRSPEPGFELRSRQELVEASLFDLVRDGVPGSAIAAGGLDELPFCQSEPFFVETDLPLYGMDFEEIADAIEPRWRSALKTASGLFRGVMLFIPGILVLTTMLSGCSSGGGSLHSSIAHRAAVRVEHDFSTGLEGWYGGREWAKSWTRDAAAGYSKAGQLALYRPTQQFTDYRLEFLGQIDGTSMGWVYRAADLQNYYATRLVVVKPGPLPNMALVRYQVVGGQETQRVQIPVRMVLHNGRPYRIQQDVAGSGFTTSIEGEVVDFWTDDRLRTGGVGFLGEKGNAPHLYWMKVSYQDDFWGKLCAAIAPSN